MHHQVVDIPSLYVIKLNNIFVEMQLYIRKYSENIPIKNDLKLPNNPHELQYEHSPVTTLIDYLQRLGILNETYRQFQMNSIIKSTYENPLNK